MGSRAAGSRPPFSFSFLIRSRRASLQRGHRCVPWFVHTPATGQGGAVGAWVGINYNV